MTAVWITAALVLVITTLGGSCIVTACPPPRPKKCSNCGSIWRRWTRAHLATAARPPLCQPSVRQIELLIH